MEIWVWGDFEGMATVWEEIEWCRAEGHLLSKCPELSVLWLDEQPGVCRGRRLGGSSQGEQSGGLVKSWLMCHTQTGSGRTSQFVLVPVQAMSGQGRARVEVRRREEAQQKGNTGRKRSMESASMKRACA